VFAGGGDDQVIWNDPTGDVVFGEGGNDILSRSCWAVEWRNARRCWGLA
jgi:hypothetical protein